MIGIHYLMGTPEIFTTVFASGLASLPYYLLFPLKLLHELKHKQNFLAYRDDPNWNRNWKMDTFSTPYSVEDFLLCVKHNIFSPSNKHKELSKYMPQNSSLNKIEPKIKFGFLGDLMPLMGCNWVISEDSKEFFSDIDYLVCNLEGVLYKADIFVAFSLLHTEEILLHLQEFLPAEKIILSLANNHGADGGYTNYKKTVSRLREMGFKVIGGRDDASLKINDAVNIVAATKWSNQAHGYLSFLEHSDKHFDPNAKFNLLFAHWGYELELYPRPEFIDEAKNYISKWGSIIGHHSHMPSPVTTVNGKLLAYSLGNCVTGLGFNHFHHGIALKLELGPDNNNEWKVGEVNWRYSCIKKVKKTLNYDLSEEFQWFS